MKRYTMLFLAVIYLCSATSFAQVPSANPTSNPRIAEWMKLRKNLERGILQKNETQEREATQAIFALDTDKMPPEWRHAFIDEQLFLCHRNGDWQRMVAIKNKIMSKKREGKKDDLLDADLLRTISGYYVARCFPPPKEVQKPGNEDEADKLALEYSQKHYADEKEEERILQYIVENFDPNYALVYLVRADLAGLRLNMHKPAEAMAGYQAVEGQDFKQLYCVPQVELNSGRMLSGKEVLERLYAPYLKEQKAVVYREMLRVTNFMEHIPDKAIEELRALRKKHLDDPELRAKLEARLRELSLKSDLIIPAEELGLPKVTSGTLTTTNTLTTSNTLRTTTTK